MRADRAGNVGGRIDVGSMGYGQRNRRARWLGRYSMKKIFAIAALVLAILAVLSVHFWKLTSLRETAIAVGLLAVSLLL